MLRILVIGTTCCGKTTFARRLSERLHIPHIELDALYWLPNWVSREPEEFRTLVKDAIANEHWVLDGNYGTIRDLVWPRATMVIWLNYGFSQVLAQGIKRTVRRALTRQVLYSNNTESLTKALFSRDSILWWLVKTYHRRRRSYRRIFDDDMYRNLKKVELRRPSQSEEYLHRCATAT